MQLGKYFAEHPEQVQIFEDLEKFIKNSETEKIY